MKCLSRPKGGFTLIELLIVVAIIAILAAIAVPNFLEAQVRAKVSRAKTDMRSIATAIEAYRVDHNAYITLVAPNSPCAAAPLSVTGTCTAFPINGNSVFYGAAVPSAVSSRFIRLTTPVAFISSVFRDPFINESVRLAIDPVTDQPLAEYDTYDYADAGTVWTGGLLAGTRGASVSSGAAWHIVSAGPDMINAFGGGTTAYDPLIKAKGCDYDPTNGTTSIGDVVRVASGTGPMATTLPTYDRVLNKFN